VYIDTGSSMPISPSKSRDLADENNKFWPNGNDSKQPYCHTLILINIFCKRQISIKLIYLYQRLQCRDNYFFKVKFVFFLYMWLFSIKGKRSAFIRHTLILIIILYANFLNYPFTSLDKRHLLVFHNIS
jgi:hypothetical protein